MVSVPRRIQQLVVIDGQSAPAVAERTGSIKVLSTDIDTFLQGGELEVGEPESAERKMLRSADEIVSIARSRLGEGGYDILHNNCEHFMNECLTGEKVSHFVSDVRSQVDMQLKR